MAVQATGGGGGWSFLQPQQPKYGTVPYANNDPNVVRAQTPGNPNFSGGGLSGDDLFSQLKQMMALYGMGGGGAEKGLNYALYTPQEMAQRGLAMSGANRGALDSQAGYINRQAGANTLKNQIAGQDIAQQAAMAKLKAAQDTHSAQGQFAANGAISSEMARQTLGSTPSAWKDTQPWMAPSGVAGMGGSMGDIAYGLKNTNESLYRQLQGIQSDYDISQAGLYNQLAQLGPQYLQLDQGNDAYNRLLSGNYNRDVSPEMRALMAALSQAT